MKYDFPGGGPDSEVSAPSTPRKESGTESTSVPFSLDSDDYRFAPDIFPDTLRVSKERELNRRSSMCGGEDISDQGSKNKEIHVSGNVKNSKRDSLWNIVNYEQKIELTSPSWSGEVRVDEVELSGPNGTDPETKQLYWNYTIDLVSTGKDEPGGTERSDGIVSGDG